MTTAEMRTVNLETCPFCGVEKSARGIGSHKKNCEKNPARGQTVDGVVASSDVKLRARIERQADAELGKARDHIIGARDALDPASTTDKPAYDALDDALHALERRAALLALLKPEIKPRARR